MQSDESVTAGFQAKIFPWPGPQSPVKMRAQAIDHAVSDKVDALSGDSFAQQVLVAAGFLNEDAALLLADDDVARIARLLHTPRLDPADQEMIRQYLKLAVSHAKALGYPVD